MKRHLIGSLSAVAAVAALAGPAFAGTDTPYDPSMAMTKLNHVPDGVMTREQVKDELRAMRQDKALPLTGEAGDTERVIAMRDKENAEQAQQIMAQYQADADRQATLQQSSDMALNTPSYYAVTNSETGTTYTFVASNE